jgi:hypothetical protein
MSRYIMIRRLRGPAFLLLVGLIALFRQLGLIDHFWHFFWPFLLIFFGVFMLAERAALAADGGYPPVPFPGSYPGSYPGPYPSSNPGGQPYPGASYAAAIDPYDPSAAASAPQYAAPETTAIVPAEPYEPVKDPEGGQS